MVIKQKEILESKLDLSEGWEMVKDSNEAQSRVLSGEKGPFYWYDENKQYIITLKNGSYLSYKVSETNVILPLESSGYTEKIGKRILNILEKKKNKITCRKMTPEEINKIKNSKKTKEAEYFYQKNEKGYKPKNKIDLGNGKVMYTTNRLNGTSHTEIIGYVINGESVELRMFYRSDSEGIWRACPGVREKDGEENGLSKGEGIKHYCYETTTKVATPLGKIFDSFKMDGIGGDPILNSVKGKDRLGYNILMEKMEEETSVDALFLSEELGDIIASEAEVGLNDDENDAETKAIFSDLIQRCEKFKKTGKTFSSLFDFIHFTDKNGVTQYWTSESIIRMYSNAIPSGLEYLHMTKLFGESYEYKHEYLGTINTDIYQVNWNGKLVNIYFSRVKDEPNLVWIDDIQYADAEVNSFGITKNSINAVPLIGKPCDYWNQTPYNPDDNPEKGIDGTPDYADIRNLYQDNPIIKHYKKLEGLL